MMLWPTIAEMYPDAAGTIWLTPQLDVVRAVMTAEIAADDDVWYSATMPSAPLGAAGRTIAPPVEFFQVPVVAAAENVALAV